MTHIDEATQKLQKARTELREFNISLNLEQVTKLVSGDQMSVESMGLKSIQTALLEKVMNAEEELRNAKEA